MSGNLGKLSRLPDTLSLGLDDVFATIYNRNGNHKTHDTQPQT